jgi:hypothetical protein
MKHVPLSAEVIEIILGSLLGDGSLKIHKNYKNARFAFRHSITQADYFYWKVKKLQDIVSARSVFEQKPDGFSSKKKFRFQSRALASLTDLHNETHKRNSLVIQRKWLNRMTAKSLAIWWFDDGSLISNGRKGVFCTDGFDKKSVKVLAQYLQVVWDIRAHIAPVSVSRHGKRQQYWRLWIRSTAELQKFLSVILPYTPLCMIDKVLLLYKDRKHQQRWISEVSKKTGLSLHTVQTAVQRKKQRWKRYRE